MRKRTHELETNTNTNINKESKIDYGLFTEEEYKENENKKAEHARKLFEAQPFLIPRYPRNAKKIPNFILGDEDAAEVKMDRRGWKSIMEQFNNVSQHLAPEKTYPINQGELEMWRVNENKKNQQRCDKPEKNCNFLDRYYGEIMARTLNHISHEEFITALGQIATVFNQKMKTSNSGRYIIILPAFYCKSNRWVALQLLGYRMLNPEPEGIITGDLSSSPLSLTNLVFVDDGIYSASQMSSFLKRVYENQSVKLRKANLDPGILRFYILVPFVTTRALIQTPILSGIPENQLIFIYAEIMKSVDDVENGLQMVIDGGLYRPPPLMTVPLTYFDHKLPDSRSADPSFMLPFIYGCDHYDCPPPPYKKPPFCDK